MTRRMSKAFVAMPLFLAFSEKVSNLEDMIVSFLALCTDDEVRLLNTHTSLYGFMCAFNNLR
jgi:hypothetical protein